MVSRDAPCITTAYCCLMLCYSLPVTSSSAYCRVLGFFYSLFGTLQPLLSGTAGSSFTQTSRGAEHFSGQGFVTYLCACVFIVIVWTCLLIAQLVLCCAVERQSRSPSCLHPGKRNILRFAPCLFIRRCSRNIIYCTPTSRENSHLKLNHKAH